MKVLLDTHAFLWWITEDQRLSERAREVISDGGNELFFSVASGWEIAIKAGLGRIEIPKPIARFLMDQLRLNRIEVLAIQLSHALCIYELPLHHRDPFDRMLVCQARVEKMPILTSDAAFAGYDLEVVW